MKIERKPNPKKHEMEKRCYLPFVVKSNCPKCGTEATADLESSYLSYPIVGEPEAVCFSCHKCETPDEDEEWEELVVLDVTLAAAHQRSKRASKRFAR
jgi:hypothetical protein